MRISVLPALAALGCLAAAAHADPINWNLQATVARVNLPALDIEVGDLLSLDMTLDSDSPAIPEFFADGYHYLNLFDAFTLNVNGHALILGPKLSDPAEQVDTNSLGTLNFPDYQVLQFRGLMYEGDTPYFAEASFEFTDTNAFPIGSLPAAPPSLASARLANLSLYSPVPNNGGLLFIAGGDVDSFTVRSVPEPSSAVLMAGALAILALGRRRLPGYATR